MRVKVVTDSTAILPLEMAEELAVTTVPVWLHSEDASYRDGIELDADALFRRMERGERFTTASPSPGDFLGAYQAAADAGYHAVVAVTVSGHLTAIHDAARAAAEVFTTIPVRIVDSESAVTGAGLAVLEAARAAAAGAGLDVVEAAAHRVATRVQILGVVDGMQYLHRSGRVGSLSYLGGRMVGVRPMFRLNRGVVTRAGLPRSIETAIERVVRLVAVGRGPIHAGIFHALAPERAADLETRLRASVDAVAETFVCPFSSAMGAHTGPGVVGVGWWRS